MTSLLLLFGQEMCSRKDTCSSANSSEVVVVHWDWEVTVDFSNKTLHCTATLDIRTLCDGVGNLVLDCVGLVVSDVTSRESGESLAHQVKQLDTELTPSLDISLPSSCAKKGAELGVRICYKTDPALCSAVQWLEPTQTLGKKLPYLFTQCQAIHARSMVPCQDTPSVKSTFSAKVTVPCELVALMGAGRLGSKPHPSDSSLTVFSFRQSVPIPSYLAALVVGALESKQIGPRSHVWCEKDMVEKAAWEFEETEKMLCAAEEVVGSTSGASMTSSFSLRPLPMAAWKTPASPSSPPPPGLSAGDRSLANVIAHELSHSWTGNLVTNENWEEFWMNEGFTTFLERIIAAKVFNEKERNLQASLGWNQMEDSIRVLERQGKAHFTPLVPDLKGLDPDEVYSCIPYEKGSSFLFYLETLLGGPGSMDGFLKAYIAKFRYGTVTTEQWKEFLFDYFQKEVSEGVFREVEWDKWIKEPGMPPLKPSFDTTLADRSITLAEKWAAIKDVNYDEFSTEDIAGMSSLALQYFLDVLQTKPPLSIQALEAMEKLYNFNKTENAEVKYRWFRLCLRGKWSVSYPLVTELLSKQGRMKYIVPLYRELCECGEEAREMAVQTFTVQKQFYAMVAAKKISKILGLN